MLLNVNIFRWNAAFRDDLVNSRVDTTKLLATAIDDMVNPPKAFVATSSIGTSATTMWCI